MSDAANNNRIDYIEFPADSVPGMKQFFAAAFGWTFTDYGDDYSSFSDGRLNGGITSDPTERPKAPLVVLYAIDLEASLAKVVAAGGTITKPIFSFPGGRRFQFSDPAGNELAVWSDK